jgi:hypothetical protein
MVTVKNGKNGNITLGFSTVDRFSFFVIRLPSTSLSFVQSSKLRLLL